MAVALPAGGAASSCRTSDWRRRKQQQLEADGAPPKRPYQRKSPHNICSKCGQLKVPETGHTQYRGKPYCPQAETISKEEWLAQHRKK